jgi:hypothetical protein
MIKRIIIFSFVLVLLSACKNDNYETGDGKHSYLQADFVEAYTSAAKELVSARTDDGDTLIFSPHVIKDWAATPDSTYRSLLYYNKVNDDRTTEVYAIAQVPVVKIHKLKEGDDISTDPLFLRSVWISSNRKYLNIEFGIKTGVEDGNDNIQTLSVVYAPDVNNSNDSRNPYIKVVHKQNGVPEYYTSYGYISVPLNDFALGTTIHLSVNTYDKGWITKDLVIK